MCELRYQALSWNRCWADDPIGAYDLSGISYEFLVLGILVPELKPLILLVHPSHAGHTGQIFIPYFLEVLMQLQDCYVNDVEAAKIISSSPQTLRNWRYLGRGPAYSKQGRMVRYKVQDLIDFMSSARIDPEARQ